MSRAIPNEDYDEIDLLVDANPIKLGVRCRKAEAECERLRGVLTDCIATAAELRREISPDKGCGYFVYKRVWDDSFAAENRAKQALAPKPKEPSE